MLIVFANPAPIVSQLFVDFVVSSIHVVVTRYLFGIVSTNGELR